MPTLTNLIHTNFGSRLFDPVKLDTPVSVESLPTPALIVDLDIFERNLDKMQGHLTSHGMGLRCHTKMHKCPVIAKKQLDRGALGVCTATVSEAEVMMEGGVDKILITSPVITQDKIDRVLTLAEKNQDLTVVVDNKEGAKMLNLAAANKDTDLKILIDLDPGMGRTGIEVGEPALQLCRFILNDCPRLRFNGLQMYAGSCMHIHGFEKRKETYHSVMQEGHRTRDLIESEGISVPVFSGGGTGTYDIEPGLGLLTELQAGSYAFMDVEYRNIGAKDKDLFLDFEPSLFVLVTAISQPQKKMITVDAGFKSFASDTVVPEFRDVEGLKYHWGGDEHGIVLLNNPSKEINLADKLAMVTSHCDPTVNLYDYCFPYRNGVVEEIWPISARGSSQ